MVPLFILLSVMSTLIGVFTVEQDMLLTVMCIILAVIFLVTSIIINFIQILQKDIQYIKNILRED